MMGIELMCRRFNFYVVALGSWLLFSELKLYFNYVVKCLMKVPNNSFSEVSYEHVVENTLCEAAFCLEDSAGDLIRCYISDEGSHSL